jgi:glycosyltransferase involved in cell wall biosynthesis
MKATSQAKKTVLHLLWSLEVGGAEKIACDLVRSLPRDEFRPLVCSILHDGPLRHELTAQGYPVYHRSSRPGVDWKTVGWLSELVRREQVELIHAHQYTPLVYAVLVKLTGGRCRVIYTEHGRCHPEVLHWKRLLVNPLLACGVERLISIAQSTRLAMARWDNLPLDQIEVIHNGVPLPQPAAGASREQKRRQLGLPSGCRLIGTAARLEEVKNLAMLVRGFALLAQQVPECRLVIAGQGSQDGRLRALAGELGVAERVHFLGLRSDLEEIYPLLEVFVLTSFTEGISVTLLEAMSHGLPAVVTEVGGNPEVVVDGETGFFVPSDDHVTLSRRLALLLKSRALAQRMGCAGRKRVESEFSFAGMLARYLELYRQPVLQQVA